MQYSVRNRRRLRQTGEQAVPRTLTARGTGVAETARVTAPAEVRAEGTGPIRTIGAALDAPVREITPSSVIRNNWQR